MAQRGALVEVGKLGSRAGELGEVAVDGEGPYTAEYGTHGRDVSRMDGVVFIVWGCEGCAQANVAELCHSLAVRGE